MFNCALHLDSQKKKNGSNVYYVSSIRVDADAGLKLTKDDETVLGNFQTIINDENNEVLDLYKNAKKSGLKTVNTVDEKIIEVVDPAEALAN